MRSALHEKIAPIFIAATLIIAGIIIPNTDIAQAKDGQDHVGLVLSNLPPHSSADYKALRDLAGEATGEMLDMTKAEMWNVPSARAGELLIAAERQGVNVIKLDQTWNHTLAPMKAGAEMSSEQKDMMKQSMDSKAAMGMSMMALPDAHVLEYAFTKGMNSSEQGAAQPSLVIPLNGKTTVTAKRTSIEKTGDSYIWHGVVERTGDPVTLLWWPSGRIAGSVTYKGHVFSVKSLGGDMHGVVEMAPRELPPEHAPMAPEMRKKMNMKVDPLVRDGDASMMRPGQGDAAQPKSATGQTDRANTRNLEDAIPARQALLSPALGGIMLKSNALSKQEAPVVISLIVAYTKQAASHYGDIEKDLIALAIEDANQSFRSSGIGNVRLELAHAYQTDYAEDGSHFDHVFRFADKDDGYMDDVHALRDRYAADVGVLIVHDPHGCGLAAQVLAPANRAFAVVHHECAATSYSLAHEIGHLIGARHDAALDDSKDPFPFGHGFVNGKKWRTMMSYMESCDGCPRLPIWSNPDLKVRGVRAGDATSNNARVIAEQAARVAAFR